MPQCEKVLQVLISLLVTFHQEFLKKPYLFLVAFDTACMSLKVKVEWWCTACAEITPCINLDF